MENAVSHEKGKVKRGGGVRFFEADAYNNEWNAEEG